MCIAYAYFVLDILQGQRYDSFMSVEIPEHKLSEDTINPRRMLEMSPSYTLVTADLFGSRQSHGRYGIANTGKILANLLRGNNALIEDSLPSSQYLGTQKTAQRDLRERVWPVVRPNELDFQYLRDQGIKARVFPSILYRFPPYQGLYRHKRGEAHPALPDLHPYLNEHIFPRIYDIDSSSLQMLQNLWGINLSPDICEKRELNNMPVACI